MNRFKVLAACALASLAVPLCAQTPYLVKDLNTLTKPAPSSSLATGFTATAGKVFFQATTAEEGTELWVSDSAGTRRVKDLVAGSGSSYPSSITELSAGVVVFGAQTEIGIELWRSDGTPEGTTLVKDINAGLNSSEPSYFTAFGSVVLFTATDATHGRELWVTDGTADGTKLLADASTDNYYSTVIPLESFGGKFYFTSGGGFWSTDGTPEGTAVVRTGLSAQSATVVGSALVLTASTYDTGNELWKTDGTTAGTVFVRDIAPGSQSGIVTNPVSLGSSAVFFAYEPSTGTNLWSTDGTAAGTKLLKTTAGVYSYLNSPVVRMGGNAYFIIAGSLWKSDGTTDGTGVVAYVGDGLRLVAGDDRVYFIGYDGAHGYEVWSSAGTAASTGIVTDINPGPSSSMSYGYSSAYTALRFTGGKLYFSPTTANGVEPWVIEGTSPAQMLANIEPDRGPSSFPDSLIARGDDLFFIAFDDVYNTRQLWKTDGTSGGTRKITTPGFGYSTSDRVMGSINGRVYFVANNYELWQSDGSDAGTGRSKDLAGLPNLSAYSFFPTSKLLYFTGVDPANYSSQLVATDGTAANTSFLGAQVPSPSSTAPMVEFAGRAYFAAESYYSGGLWATAGTAGTTKLVTPVTGMQLLTASGDRLYFRLTTQSQGTELWSTDGSADGTAIVKDIVAGTGHSSPSRLTAAGSLLFFVATDGVNGTELWRTDGTAAGTVLVKDIMPGTASSNPTSLRALGNVVFFAADDGINGVELWKSDGTAAGTTLVLDVAPGAASSNPTMLLGTDGRMWFSANDGVHGTELWSTDGTAANTILYDIDPGAIGSVPNRLTRAGRRIFFNATTSATGNELWALNLDATALNVSDTFASESAGSVRFVVRREGDSSGVTTVQYATADGSAKAGTDYTAVSGTLTFNAGETTKNVDIAIANDSVTELAKSFRLTLSAPSGAVLTVTEATAVINDDDRRAELTLDYFPNGSSTVANDRVRYFTITNAGPSTATNVQFSVNVTPFWEGFYLYTNNVPVSCSGSVFPTKCSVGPIPSGVTAQIQFQMNGSRGDGDETNPPGITVSASVTADEVDSNAANNVVSAMSSTDGQITVPAYLVSGQSSTLMYAYAGGRSAAFEAAFSSSNPAVVISPASISIGAFQTSATTSISASGEPGWTTLSLQVPWTSTVYRMTVPIVAPSTKPLLDTALLAYPTGSYYYSYSIPYGEGFTVIARPLARADDGAKPAGTITVLKPDGTTAGSSSIGTDGQVSIAVTGGLDPGSYTFKTRYSGDSKFRAATIAGPLIQIDKLRPALTLTMPGASCGFIDVVVTVSSPLKTLVPPGDIVLTWPNAPSLTIPLAPTGQPGEARGVARIQLPAGSYVSLNASYAATKYFESAYAYEYLQVPTVCTPASVAATAVSSSQVLVTWTGSGGLYEVTRGETMNLFTYVGSSTSRSFTDMNAAPGKTYFYKVRAVDVSGAASSWSAPDMATTVAFSDNPTVRTVTMIKASHILELRTAANALRAAAGLPAATFEALGIGSSIRANDIVTLRSAIFEARTVLGLPLPPFTDSSLTGVPMKAVHIEELRNGVR